MSTRFENVGLFFQELHQTHPDSTYAKKLRTIAFVIQVASTVRLLH